MQLQICKGKSLWALILMLWLHAADASNILVFVAFPMKSHNSIFHPLVRELAGRGHQVTFFSCLPLEEPVPKSVRQVVVPNYITVGAEVVPPSFVFGRFSALMTSYYSNAGIYATTEAVLADPEAQKIIHSDDKYDLIIHESFLSEAVVALQHKFKAPGISLMPLTYSVWVNEISGLTNNPAYMIDYKTDLSDVMSFSQRIVNFYNLVSTLLVSYAFLHYHQQLMDKYMNYTGWEDRPSIHHLLGDQALILVNSHHSFGYNFPKAPHVKEVGGINLRPPKPLPKELQQLMDDSKEGVIYFSFGTNIEVTDVFTEDVVDAFLKVFSKQKQRVLWKSRGVKRLPLPKNLIVSEWFPQQHILAHKNIKLFITHGGQASLIEAVNHAVPLLGIPFFADQRRNARRIAEAGFGLSLDYSNLTEASISWAVDEILNNQRYKKEALRRQRLFLDRPMNPIQESVYWVEYVLKHGNVLRPASAQMPLYKLLLLDVLGAIAVGIIVLLYGANKLRRHLMSRLRRSPTEKLKRT